MGGWGKRELGRGDAMIAHLLACCCRERVSEKKTDTDLHECGTCRCVKSTMKQIVHSGLYEEHNQKQQ